MHRIRVRLCSKRTQGFQRITHDLGLPLSLGIRSEMFLSGETTVPEACLVFPVKGQPLTPEIPQKSPRLKVFPNFLSRPFYSRVTAVLLFLAQAFKLKAFPSKASHPRQSSPASLLSPSCDCRRLHHKPFVLISISFCWPQCAWLSISCYSRTRLYIY